MLWMAFTFNGNIRAQSKKGFDLDQAIIPLEFIKDGGLPRDGIPSIDYPEFLSVGEATFLNDSDRILGVKYKGVQKAYPIKILNYHEIVNDYFDGQPIVITFCPLCGSGIAFDALIEGSPKTFGVSGLLYNSDVLLYDRQTESLWSQIRGEAVAGPLAGIPLETVTTQLLTWGIWKEKYPFTKVLSTKTGYVRDYSHDPYPSYYKSEELWFPVEHKNDTFHPKTKILGIALGGTYKSYPFPELDKSGAIITDRIRGKEIRIRFDRENQTAILESPAGEDVEATTLFWFAWVAFHPETEVYYHSRE